MAGRHHAGGYGQIVGPGEREFDTVKCRHCQRIVAVKPGSATTVYLLPRMDGTWKEEPGAWCTRCMGPICLECHATGRCTPFERKIEEQEARGRLFQVMGIE
jgi:hypothetical protein